MNNTMIGTIELIDPETADEKALSKLKAGYDWRVKEPGGWSYWKGWITAELASEAVIFEADTAPLA